MTPSHCFLSCQFLAKKFCPGLDAATLLSDHAVCLCDDDNDVQMAEACLHAYIPEVSAENMAAMIEQHPDHYTLTGGPKISGPSASEAALKLILERLPDPVPAINDVVA